MPRFLEWAINAACIVWLLLLVLAIAWQGIAGAVVWLVGTVGLMLLLAFGLSGIGPVNGGDG